MNYSQIVTTPDCPGTIELIETFRTCTRYGLEKNPYSFEVAYYFEGEVDINHQSY